MKVLYVAKHGSGGNDDEGAVEHALHELGHAVIKLDEAAQPPFPSADICLFHKWDNPDALRRIECPRVFWYFDLVNSKASELQLRDQARIGWMQRIVPHVTFGFCTDGDWVFKDTTGKLFWLPQGADERMKPSKKSKRDIPILFVGDPNGGRARQHWVQHMKGLWGNGFMVVKRGVYREKLSNLLANAEVIVGANYPVTDRYWSNRVYTMLIHGAAMVHTVSSGLAEQYKPNESLVYTTNWEESDVSSLLLSRRKREELRSASRETTLRSNLYRHRVEKMLEVLKSYSIP